MTEYRRSSTIPFLTILLLAFSAGLSAAPVDSRITSVTVYSDRAIVTRTATNELTAGEHTLTFENLPTALADPSLQASGFGVPGATILDVSAQIVFAETSTNDRVKSLEDQIRNLQKQRRVLDDRSKILEEQRAFVQRMLQASTNSPSAPAGGAVARPTLDEWQRLFSYTEESLGKVSTEQQSIDGQREELQAKQTALEKQLNELRGARGRQSKTVTVRVSLTAPGRLDVAVRYSIPNAGWSPAYTARLRSTDRAIDLSYFGVVQNGTGEDWNDIALTLSTARPGLGGGAPELQPWIADIVRARPGTASSFSTSTAVGPDLVGEVRLQLGPVDAEAGRGNASVGLPMLGNNVLSMSSIKSGKIASPPAESEAGLMAADIDANITSATFKIPVSVSVAGNNASQKVAIKDARLAATLQFQSTPRILEAAFLSASASNTTDFPLLAGPINTYLDDTFVAANNLKTVMPGEKFELALGADEGIAVKRRLVFADDTGGTQLSSILAAKKIATLPTPGTGATILKTRVLVQNQQLCRLDRESAPAAYRIDPAAVEKLFAKAIAAHDAVILSDYAKGLLTDDLVTTVTRLARAAGKFIALDPKPKRALAFADLDLITPNRKEALQLAGIEPDPHAPFPAEKVCARLHELYRTHHLVITMSEDGMLLSTDGKIGKVIPTAAREVFDVSGAGDTALASLVVALTAGAKIETAANFSNAASGVVVGKLGTATVTPDELLAYIKK